MNIDDDTLILLAVAYTLIKNESSSLAILAILYLLLF